MCRSLFCAKRAKLFRRLCAMPRQSGKPQAIHREMQCAGAVSWGTSGGITPQAVHRAMQCAGKLCEGTSTLQQAAEKPSTQKADIAVCSKGIFFSKKTERNRQTHRADTATQQKNPSTSHGFVQSGGVWCNHSIKSKWRRLIICLCCAFWQQPAGNPERQWKQPSKQWRLRYRQWQR